LEILNGNSNSYKQKIPVLKARRQTHLFILNLIIVFFKFYFRSAVLPPISIEPWQDAGGRESVDLVRQDNNIDLSTRPLAQLSSHNPFHKEKKNCDLCIPKPNALPPMNSCDGTQGTGSKRVQLPFQKSLIMRHREHYAGRSEPRRKRAKTHNVYKECRRGDSWELLKAEKIRCVELSKYEEKLEAERKQQKRAKRAKNKKGRDDVRSSRPVGRVRTFSRLFYHQLKSHLSNAYVFITNTKYTMSKDRIPYPISVDKAFLLLYIVSNCNYRKITETK